MSIYKKAFQQKALVQRAFILLLAGVLFGGGLAVCRSEPSFAAEAEGVVVTKPIYHKHTGSSAGGGCYGERKTRTERQEIPCGGTMVYYPATDTTGCDGCGAGFSGDQSGRSCWTTKVIEHSVTYYDINCGKSSRHIGTLELRKSTEDWTKELTLTASLENFGDIRVSGTPYIWNGTPSAEAVYPVSENGAYSLELQADANTDTAAGRIDLDIRNIDYTAPVMGEYRLSDTEWTKEDIVLSLSDLQDLQPDGSGGCGLAENGISFDGGESYEAATEKVIEESGTYIICLRDKLENTREYPISITNVDKTGPAFRLVDYSQEENLRENQITVEAEDLQPDGTPGCGLADLPYSFDEGKTWEENNSWKVTVNGTYPVWVQDKLGNITKTEVVITNIDTFGPTVTHRLEPAGWSRVPIRLTFFVEDLQPDGKPGIGLPENFIDWGEGWNKITSTFNHSNRTVKIRCRDSYGNLTEYQVEITNLDNLAPEVTITVDKNPIKKGETALLQVEAEDYESGLHETPYSYDRGASWTAESSREVTEPGEYPVWVRDAVENISFQSVTIEEALPLLPKKQTKPGETLHPLRNVPAKEPQKEPVKVTVPVLKRQQAPKEVKTVEEKLPFWKEDWFGNLIALGGIGVLAGCLWLLYYYGYATIRIYNFEEGEKYFFMGRERVTCRDGEYRLLILKEMVEASVTTRYQLRPGSWFVRLHRGETLILDFAGEYQTLTEIEREMIVQNHIATSLKL